MPGANIRALEKARTLPADALILDLEDAVSPGEKDLAREQVGRALAAGGYGPRECIARVNGLGTPWGKDDVEALATAGADAFLFPKIDGPEDVHAAVEALDEAGAPPGTPIWIMAETPRGILELAASAGASPRVECIVAGTSDLSKDMRAAHTPDRIGFLAPLSHLVLCARANGLDVLDGVHLSFRDLDELEAHCRQGRALGFDGKTLIHPSQIETANRIFAHGPGEVANAAAVLEAWRHAATEGRGVAVLDGRLIEHLHVAEARRTLELSAAIAARSETGPEA